MDVLFFLREYFRVQRNLFNYLWNLKYLAYKKEIPKRENNRKENQRKGKSESVKKFVEFSDATPIYRGYDA